MANKEMPASNLSRKLIEKIILPKTFHFVHLQPFGVDDSDVGSPKGNHASAESSSLCVGTQQAKDPIVQLIEEQGDQKKVTENSGSEMEPLSISPAGESYRSMGEILSSMDPGHPLPVSGLESGAGKVSSKVTGTNHTNSKRSTFWGRSNVSIILFIVIFIHKLSFFL